MIDFTALDRISGKEAQQKPQEARTAVFKKELRESTPQAEKEPQTDAHKVIANLQKRDRALIAQAKAVYTEHRENAQKAGELRTEITKGIQRAEDPLTLLLKAIECISLMTGDRAILTQAEGDIRAIYGHTLEYPAPLKEELAKAQQTIDKLQQTIGSERLPPDELQRATKALKELEAKKEIITNEIKEITLTGAN